MALLICNKAEECNSNTCKCKYPHRVDLRKKENKWHIFTTPNLHPFHPCANARCIRID